MKKLPHCFGPSFLVPEDHCWRIQQLKWCHLVLHRWVLRGQKILHVLHLEGLQHSCDFCRDHAVWNKVTSIRHRSWSSWSDKENKHMMKSRVKSELLDLSDKKNRTGNESWSEFDQCQLSREPLMAGSLQILLQNPSIASAFLGQGDKFHCSIHIVVMDVEIDIVTWKLEFWFTSMRYPGPRSNKSSRSITVPKRTSYQFPDLELNEKTWRGQNRTLSATFIATITQSAFKLFHLGVIFRDGSIIFRDIGDEKKQWPSKFWQSHLILMAC